jgi:ABC-type transport system substrate-binding protein/class 3 adenylate cyclase
MAVIDGERRVVAVLMADVAGSTAIGERLGPERSKFLFDEVMRLMTAEIERFDGTVAQLLGDGLLAMFGAPVAHEDDSERAVRAGLAIQQSLAAYAAEVSEAYGVDLKARIAVNTGPVVVTPGAGADSGRYNALGDTVNVTARLQALAMDTEVTLGPQTAQQVRECFELEPLGETQLRGREQPIDRYRVVAERERDPDRRRPSEPLVGRRAELAAVEDALDRLADGIGVIVSITGEPGIGKSRLLAEAAQSTGERIRVLEGRALSYTESFPYWPVRELLRDWLGAGVTASEARVRLDLKTALHGVFGDDREPYPFLAGILGLQPDAEARDMLREFSSEAVHRRSMEVVADLLQRLAQERPLLVVFEDLHWSDRPTLDLIESLLDLTESEPLGLALLYRSDREHPSWRVGERARQRFPHRYREIELRPLTESDSHELVGRLAGGELPEDVQQLLAQRAGGNPLFLAEALRDLIERGSLERSQGGWVASGGSVEVPALVQAVLQARLDRLDPAAREVVSAAAVAGRRFGTPLMERLVDPSTLPAALSELLRLELIVEEQRRPYPAYRFRHGLVQEAAYAAITDSGRRALHGRVGIALEDLYMGEGLSPRLLEVLARHFTEADDAERAARYLIRAGDAARALYAEDEAVMHYREARRFLQRVGDDRRSRETLFKIALVHHLSFSYPEAEAAYDEAFACKVMPMEQTPVSERLSTAILRPREIVPGLSYVSDENMVTEHLFTGLLRVDRDLNVMPALADNFRVSADGLSYLFQIRSSARWSDGSPVTAGDFVETWRHARELDTAAAFLLEDVESAEALDDHTLEVRLREPRNYFLYVLAATAAYPWPIHLWDASGIEWRNALPLVSNGPYVLSEVDEDGMTLSANPAFEGPRGNVAEIRIHYRAEGTSVLEAWDEFELDVIANIERSAVGHELARATPALGATMLGFHPEGPYADERVRAAVAAPLIALMGELEQHGMAVRPAAGGGLLPPAMPGHTRVVNAPLTIEQAAELLAEAGYPGGEGLGPVRLVAPPPMRPLLDGLDEWLGRLGLTAVVDWVAPGTPTSPLDCDAWLSGWVADYPDPDGFFRGLLSGRHMEVLCDEELTRLLAEARGCRIRDERLGLYAAVDRRLVERSLIVPLSYSRSVVLRRPWVRDLWSNALTQVRFDQASVDR